MRSQQQQSIKLLDLTIVPNEYKVLRAGQDLKLPNLSFQLLIYLIEHAQALCTLEQISEAVWANTVVSNDTIVQRITLLRKALDDDAKSPKYIESVRGKGYRLLPLPTYSLVSNEKKSKVVVFSVVVAFVSIGLLSIWFTLFAPQPMLTQATNQTDDAINSLIERGNYYYNIGQNQNLELAKTLFSQALEKEPLNVEALTGLSLVLSRSVCRYNQDITKVHSAKSLANKAIVLNGNSSVGHFALAYAWDCIGNLELALLNYTTAMQLNPKDAASMGSAAHLYYIKGELLTAYSLSKAASELNPNNHMLKLQIAAVLSLLQFNEDAKAEFKNLFELYPDNVFVNQAYPKFLFERGQLEEAQSAFNITLERNIDRASIYADYAEVIWLLEDKSAALYWFEKAAQLSGDNSYANTVYQIVQNTLDKNQALARIDTLSAIVEQGNTWPINYIEAALISLWALNDTKKSIEYLQKAVNLGYLNSEYLRRSPLFASLRSTGARQQENSSSVFFELLGNIDSAREKRQKDFLLQYPDTF